VATASVGPARELLAELRTAAAPAKGAKIPKKLQYP
jgi:hypothetical protein